METASQSAVNITQNLHSTSSKYEKYKDKIEEGSRRIKEIQKKEKLEELKLKFSFYLFLFSKT